MGNHCHFNFLTKFRSWLKTMKGSWSLDLDGNLTGKEEKEAIIEEIIDKEILQELLSKITINEGEVILEVDVVVVILEAIEKVDTIEKTKEIGPKGEISVVTEEDEVGEVIITVVTTTTIDNKVKDPKETGRTRISL